MVGNGFINLDQGLFIRLLYPKVNVSSSLNSYPKLKVVYGDVQESEIPCVDITKNPDEMDDAMFKLDFDMGDLLQWLLAQFNCKTLSEMADYDPNKHIGDLQNKFNNNDKM